MCPTAHANLQNIEISMTPLHEIGLHYLSKYPITVHEKDKKMPLKYFVFLLLVLLRISSLKAPCRFCK